MNADPATKNDRASRLRARIEDHAYLNAFVSLTAESGAGALVAVKDNIAVRATVTTAGADALSRRPATEDAQAVRFMRSHGGSVIGKANLHEWACGPTGLSPYTGDTRNPRAPGRIAGGSSSGSAAAVAAGLCDWAIGTDSGGSIRIPASLCGVVGFKPTLGLVSTDGVVPVAPSLDTVGVLAPNMRMAAAGISQLTGDGQMALPPNGPDLGSLPLGVAAEWVTNLDGPTRSVWARVMRHFPRVPVPDRAELAAATLDIFTREAADQHRIRLRKQPTAYGADVRRVLRAGLRIKRGDYRVALQKTRSLRTDLEAAMANHAGLVMPATACVAPYREDATLATWEPLTRFALPLNGTGQPAVVLPLPVDPPPLGVQIVGHHGHDAQLATVALALEAALPSLLGSR